MANQWLGNVIDQIGTAFKLPEWGISEVQAAGPTTNTGVTQQSRDAGYLPYTPAYQTPKVANTAGGAAAYAQTPTYSAPQSNGSVQGVGTSSGSGGGNPDTTYVWDPSLGMNVKLSDLQARQASAEQGVRDSINNGYNSYFAQLDSMLNNDLPTQRANQEGIVNSQLTQGMNTLNSNLTQGQADLATQQRQADLNKANTLRDLAQNIQNQMKAGQIYLGGRGAGDSSAANQYSYAIAKMGNQSRGNVLNQSNEISNQIADRQFKLKNTYDTETKNIQETANQNILQVANWFSQAQQQLKQAKAEGQLKQGQDLATLSQNLLAQATQQVMALQQQAAQKQSQLETWAMNNAKDIQTLATNMRGISNYSAPGLTAPAINGGINLNGQTSLTSSPGTGYGGYTGNTTDKQKYVVQNGQLIAV